MGRIGILALCLLVSLGGYTQNSYNTALKLVQEEQKAFNNFIAQQTFDENIKNYLVQFGSEGVNKSLVTIRKMNDLKNDDKAQAVKTINFFLKDLRNQLANDRLNIYMIPNLVTAFNKMLPAFIKDQSVDKYLLGLDWRSTQILANTFWQYDSPRHIENISTYRRLVRTPEYIIPFLEKNPTHPMNDTLVAFYTSHYPHDLVVYLRKNSDGPVAELVAKHRSKYAREITALSGNLNATEVVPFTDMIVENEISVDSILDKRKKVTEYFQLLVNTAIKNKQTGNQSTFQKALQSALYDKSMDFYAREINELHSSPDAVRFASIKNLRPQDIYYIIVSSDNELYTSSYLGLYKRLMKFFEKQPSDSLFRLVHYDQFRKFLRIASGYNTLSDFLSKMSPSAKKQVVHEFISGLADNKDPESIVKEAVDVADAMMSFAQDSAVGAVIGQELLDNFEACKKTNSWQCVRLYSILYQLYKGMNKEEQSSIAQAMRKYERLPVNELKNGNGEIVQLVVFFGDEDGKASFRNFMNLFKKSDEWEVEQTEKWVRITSKKETQLSIYANLPLDIETEKDIEAQQALSAHLAAEGKQPSIVIHRGHSYHLKHTLKYLNPSVKLAILGSCGGYNNAVKIVTANPDLQLIASKQVGSMYVNDPMLQKINDRIVDDKDLDWPQIWAELEMGLKSNKEASKMLKEYVPPYKNVSLFVIKLYNNNYDTEALTAGMSR